MVLAFTVLLSRLEEPVFVEFLKRLLKQIENRI